MLKHSIFGKNFINLRNIKNHIFFALKLEEFDKAGIEKLPEQWEKVLKNHGRYVID